MVAERLAGEQDDQFGAARFRWGFGKAKFRRGFGEVSAKFRRSSSARFGERQRTPANGRTAAQFQPWWLLVTLNAKNKLTTWKIELKKTGYLDGH